MRSVQICMCAALAADKYSPRRGPEMDEKRVNEKELSQECLESSAEVDKAQYKHNNILHKNNGMLGLRHCTLLLQTQMLCPRSLVTDP